MRYVKFKIAQYPNMVVRQFFHRGDTYRQTEIVPRKTTEVAETPTNR